MARGILITELLRAQDFHIEVRTSDPSSPADGRCWVRSDLDAEADKAGEFRFSLSGQTYSVWVMEPTTTPAGVQEYLRIETGAGIKVLPLANRADAIQPEISVETPSGIYGAWSPPEISVNTLSAENIQTTSAELNGELAQIVNSEQVDAYFEWRQTGASSWNTTSIQSLQSAQQFVENLSNLQSDTDYEFRAYGEDINYSSYSSFGSIISFSTQIEISDPGTQLYLLEDNGDNIMSLSLSTAFDINTYSQDKTFNLSSIGGLPRGLTWTPKGQKLHFAGGDQDRLYEATASTPFDISTLSFNYSMNHYDLYDNPYGTLWNDDGTKFYYVSDGENTLIQYTASTPFDLSSTSFDSAVNIQNNTSSQRDIAWKDDGTKLYVLDIYGDAEIHSFTASTAFEITSLSHNASSGPFTDPFGDTINNLAGMAFGPNGIKVIVGGFDSNNIYRYDLNTAWDITQKQEKGNQLPGDSSDYWNSIIFNGAPHYSGYNG